MATESRLYPSQTNIASVSIKTSTTPLVGSSILPASGVIRSMVQMEPPFARFEFKYPPSSINFDGIGAEYTELPRPLMTPAVDVKASKSYRVSFEFLVASNYVRGAITVGDGVKTSIEPELKTLEAMANRPIPVRFENFDVLMTGNSWYIADMSFNAVRYNTEGNITACQVSISLINFVPITQRFVSLPTISYKPKKKKTSSSGKKDAPSLDEAIDETYLDTVGSGNTPQKTTSPSRVTKALQGL